MFLIFGIKRMNRRLATVLALCAQCHTPAAQVVVRLSTWFSLFFIPVIPLGSKYVSTCTLCGKSVKIDKVQALQMVAVSQQASSGSPQFPVSQPDSLAPPSPQLAPPSQESASPTEP
jgi:zinc-ribbon family